MFINYMKLNAKNINRTIAKTVTSSNNCNIYSCNWSENRLLGLGSLLNKILRGRAAYFLEGAVFSTKKLQFSHEKLGALSDLVKS